MIRSEKECFKCQTIKPLAEFYKHKAMADGHLNKCKACAKSDVAKHREENLEKIRAYDRDRAKNKERIQQAVEVTRAWRAEDTRRVAAHNAVARAIKSGQLKKKSCEKCGSKKSVAHHDDYNKKLAVTWLCQPCHKKKHKELDQQLRKEKK